MALPAFTNLTDPSQEDYRRTRKQPQQSGASSMSNPTPDRATKQQRDPAQQDAIRRRIANRRNLSEDPYQLKAQGA